MKSERLKFTYLAVLIASGLFAHSVGGFGPFFTFSFLLALYLSLATWVMLSIGGIAIHDDFHIHHRTMVGEKYSFDLTIQNVSSVPWPWLSASVEIPGGVELNQPVCHCGIVPPRERHRFSLVMCFSRRGRYSHVNLRLVTRDILGLFDQETVIEEELDLIVLPKVIPIFGGFVSSGQPLGQAFQNIRFSENMVQLLGLRQYFPGDSIRRIHWKTTARTGNLMVRTYRHLSQSQVYIYLDCCADHHHGQGDHSSFEQAVIIAASLANHFLKTGMATGLVAKGAPIIRQEAYNHPEQLRHLLENLAMADTFSGKLDDIDILRELETVIPGSMIVVISPLDTQQLERVALWLQQYRGRVAIVQLDGDSFAIAEHPSELGQNPQCPWVRITATDDLSVALGGLFDARFQ